MVTFFAVFSFPESSVTSMPNFVAMGNGELGLLASCLQHATAAILDARFSEVVQAVIVCLCSAVLVNFLVKSRYLSKAYHFFNVEYFCVLFNAVKCLLGLCVAVRNTNYGDTWTMPQNSEWRPPRKCVYAV